ncbi:hypothetical protein Tco_0027228 [Tanacetum coccineum]
MAVVARCRDCHRPWGYEQSMNVGCIKNLQYLDDGLHLETNHDTHEQAIKRAAALVAAVEPAKDVTTSLESALVYWHVEIGIRALGYRELGCIREMSQSLSSNVPDNSLEQEAATGPSIPTRLDLSTSQAIQLPELGLTLTPTTGHVTTFSDGKPASETPELNPEDVTARLEDIEVEIDTLHADTDDKELLISELQDSLAVAENKISLLQIRVVDVEDKHAEDHDQIQIILARLGL